MTKKEKLIWRLKEKPSAEGIARLVEQKVITAEEGREILFSESSPNAKAQEEEIKFLRELVDKLAVSRNKFVTIYETWHDYSPIYPRWYKRYEPIMVSYNNSSLKDNFSVSNNSNMIDAKSLSTGTNSTTSFSSIQGSINKLSSLNNK